MFPISLSFSLSLYYGPLQEFSLSTYPSYLVHLSIFPFGLSGFTPLERWRSRGRATPRHCGSCQIPWPTEQSSVLCHYMYLYVIIIYRERGRDVFVIYIYIFIYTHNLSLSPCLSPSPSDNMIHPYLYSNHSACCWPWSEWTISLEKIDSSSWVCMQAFRSWDDIRGMSSMESYIRHALWLRRGWQRNHILSFHITLRHGANTRSL